MQSSYVTLPWIRCGMISKRNSAGFQNPVFLVSKKRNTGFICFRWGGDSEWEAIATGDRKIAELNSTKEMIFGTGIFPAGEDEGRAGEETRCWDA